MRHLPNRTVVRILVGVFFLVPSAMFAQSKTTAPAADPGWGSVWLQPPNDQERKWQDALRRINAAQKAHNDRAELELCDKLVGSMPNSTGPYMVRAASLGRMKQFERAFSDLDQAQKLAQSQEHPSVTSNVLVIRAHVHELQKNERAASSDLLASVKLNENNAEACNALAWLRATTRDAALRDGRVAVRLAQKAVALTTRNSYAPLDTLAAAYAEAADYPRATDYEKQAMAAGEKEIKDPSALEGFQIKAADRLRLFERHQPYRADPL